MFTEEIKKSLTKIVLDEEINLEHPALLEHGDYSTNIALILAKKRGENPKQLAEQIVKQWQEAGLPEMVEKIEVAGPGFINIWLKFDSLISQVSSVLGDQDSFGRNEALRGKKIMVEYGHPNTHKELHIGHMRTLITGEALARIFEACGATVFRANYQGDIGPHVAKAIFGTRALLKERNLTFSEAEKFSNKEKAHLLGEGYIKGNVDYDIEKEKTEIDLMNLNLYRILKDKNYTPDEDPNLRADYERTRKWSLDYYNDFYERFYTKFDRLFFESEVFDKGKKIVEENLGKIFEKSREFAGDPQEAIIFDGEKFGLHKRVFITANETPTYEAKEMALASEQFAAFAFDQNIHVVGNEQAGYFKVVIKAIELLFPDLKGRENHLPMGMVSLVGRKMSSRTGEILRVDDLLSEIKLLLEPLIQNKDIGLGEKEVIAEIATIAAIKYSVLRVDPKTNVIFDPKQSVSLQGNSGSYLQYTYARTQNVLAKAKNQEEKLEIKTASDVLSEEEQVLLRSLYLFPQVIKEAALTYSPNLICNFLFDLAQKFNLFYDKQRIIGSENESFRLVLTAATGQIIKNGLNLLGIKALEKM